MSTKEQEIEDNVRHLGFAFQSAGQDDASSILASFCRNATFPSQDSGGKSPDPNDSRKKIDIFPLSNNRASLGVEISPDMANALINISYDQVRRRNFIFARDATRLCDEVHLYLDLPTPTSLVILSVWSCMQCGDLLEIGKWKVRLSYGKSAATEKMNDKNESNDKRAVSAPPCVHWFVTGVCSLMRMQETEAQTQMMGAITMFEKETPSGRELQPINVSVYKGMLYLTLGYSFSATHASFEALRAFREAAKVFGHVNDPESDILSLEDAEIAAGSEFLRIGSPAYALEHLKCVDLSRVPRLECSYKQALGCCYLFLGKANGVQLLIEARNSDFGKLDVSTIRKLVPNSICSNIDCFDHNCALLKDWKQNEASK